MRVTEHLPPDLERAVWEGDYEYLDEHAHCVCCCAEHTFTTGCPAYAWGGCRGQTSTTRQEIESWARHYERFHGMSQEQFYGIEGIQGDVS